MSLLLDLHRLRSGTEHVDREAAPGDFADPTDDFRIVAPVKVVVDAQKDAQKVRLRGRVATKLECTCSRCLDPFEIPIDAAVDVLFLPAPKSTQEEEREIADDDLGVSFYEDETINLVEVVREQCYLALPMKPLCREDCKGLCPICGVNRNREQCSCQAAWVDPRLEPLKKLRER